MKELTKDEIREEILHIWDHAGLDAEVDARLLAIKLNKTVDTSSAGSRSGRQLQHPQIGAAFGREGVLGAMSNNIEGISAKDITTKNNIAAKKINAGTVTQIVYSLIGENSNKPLYFPVMWTPVINYFLGKLFGDRKIDEKTYYKGIKSEHINEGTTMVYKLNKLEIIEEAFRLDSPPKLQTFAARGTKTVNSIPHDKFLNGLAAIGTLPIASTIIGGAIGNTIHGEDGVDPITGLVYDVQANNDDEYDVSGAVLGGITGTLGSGAIAMTGVSPNTRKVTKRIERDGYTLSPREKIKIDQASRLAKVYNLRLNLDKTTGL